MRWGPKSLSGQMALLLAVALLLAQSVNFFLLIQSRDRLREARRDTVIARVEALVERKDLLSFMADESDDRRWRRPPGVYITDSPLADKYRLRPRMTERFRKTLAGSSYQYASSAKVAYLTPVEVSELRRHERPPRPRFVERREGGNEPPPLEGIRDREPRHESSRSSLLFSLQMDDGRWLNLAQYMSADPPLGLLALGAQTVIIYFVLLGATLLLSSRISRPLERLTAATSKVLIGKESRPVEPEGPDDVRRLTAAFNDMQDRIVRSFAEKDVMLGAIGHDLKTPLTSLRIRVESIDNDKLRNAMTATLEDMSLQLDDILSLARNGDSEAPTETVALHSFVEGLVVGQPVWRDKVRLGSIPVTDFALRPVWVRRILRNLIENAVRYGHQAEVSATLDADKVTFIIDDSGPGIPEDQLEAVKEPFVRGESSRNKATGGTGLGLALVDQLIKRHDGELILENRAEGGLRAIARIPSVSGV